MAPARRASASRPACLRPPRYHHPQACLATTSSPSAGGCRPIPVPLKDAQLIQLEQALGAGDAGAGDADGVFRLRCGDGVIAARVGVLGLVAASAEPI